MRHAAEQLSWEQCSDLKALAIHESDVAVVARAWAEALGTDEATAVRALDETLRTSDYWWDWGMRFALLAHVGAMDMLEELERHARVEAPYRIPKILLAMGRPEEALAAARAQVMTWPSSSSLDRYFRLGGSFDPELQERVFHAMNVEGSILEASLSEIADLRSKYPCPAADAALRTRFERIISQLGDGQLPALTTADIAVAAAVARECNDREALDLLFGSYGGATAARAAIRDVVDLTSESTESTTS